MVGTDGVGKTPIAKALSEHYGLPYFKFANEVEALKSNKHPGQHMLWFDYGLTQVMEQTGLRIVSDRCFICEKVYAGYFGRETNWDLLYEVTQKHAELKSIVIFLWDSKILSHPKEDEFVSTCDIEPIQRRYHSEIYYQASMNLQVVSYDVSTSAQCETFEQRLSIDLPNLVKLIDRINNDESF